MEKTNYRIFFRPSVNRIIINQNTFFAMGYPKRVRLLFNNERKEIAVQACNEHEPLSFKVPKDFNDDSHGFEITSKIFFNKIFEIQGWDRKNRYRVYGKHYENDNMVVFSLNDCQVLTSDDEEA